MTPTSPARPPAADGAAWIGRPIDRVDGLWKVTGAARYSGEQPDNAGLAYGFLLGATIATGRIAAIDTQQAERAPGVLLVLTHLNAPKQTPFGARFVPKRFERSRPVLADAAIHHYDQPVALVVATTAESARAAAGLIDVRYEASPGRFDLAADIPRAYRPEQINAGMATDTDRGDFASAFESAPVRIDATYSTAPQNHNAMEPHAAIAAWSRGPDGEQLTLHTSTQTVHNTRTAVANTLGLKPEQVRIVSRFVGGGFGAKLGVRPETIAAALAARLLGQPVKVVQTRQQMFANVGHRPASIQRVRLGATPDGKLQAIGHEVWSHSTPTEEFAEQTAAFTRSLYAAPHRITRHRLVLLDIPCGDTLRAPGEAPGMLAVESAMDELAERLSLDPIELRLRNEPALDPERQVPFSSRGLVACLRVGARRFGWERRLAAPGRLRDGELLIGYGVASAIRPNYLQAARASVRIDRHARVLARLDMTDIGTGSYTILSQIAADALGVPLSSVTVQLGDSDFPRTAGSGGSFGAASAGSALHNACLALRQQIASRAVEDARGPLGGAGDAAAAVFADGRVTLGERQAPLAALTRRVAARGLEAQGDIAPGETYKTYSQHAFGAHFAQVAVRPDSGEIRLQRMLGVFAAGRILNPKTAHSQMIGGMIWGASAALIEGNAIDPRHGHFVNADLAHYHVPVNADVGEVDAVFLDEYDDKGNPLGIKGIGELGICGAGAAVANAVYNATGVRVREFPIVLEKVFLGLAMASNGR